MKTISKVRIIFNVLFVVVVVIGLSSFSGAAKASVAEKIPAGIVSSAQAGVQVAAARPWTAAEMAAAIPYPMDVVADASPSYDTLAGPDGPAVAAGAAAPGKAPAVVPSLSDALGFGATGYSAAGYGYPEPFTRMYVSALGSETSGFFKTVGKLFFHQINSSYPGGADFVCSAAAIANNGVWTAGHCVHDGGGSHWSTNVIFVPAYRNGVAPYGQWAPNSLWTFTDWINTGNPGRDEGALQMGTLGGYTIGQKVGYLGYAYNWSRVQDWWMIGYPQAAPFTGKYMTLCTASYGYNAGFGTPALIAAGCDMTGGSSGGPWVLKWGTGWYINGINAYKYTNPAHPLELISPYFDATTGVLLAQTRTW